MKQFESVKRLILLQLRILCLAFEIALYIYVYYNKYIQGIVVYFYGRGHWLIIFLYSVLLFFFIQTYGGFRIGYLKPTEVFISHIFAIICANLFGYAQLSLLSGWFAAPKPMLAMTFVQLIGVGVWTILSDGVYRRLFPPRELLLIHGNRPYEDIVEKFKTRKDKYKIVKCISASEDFEVICEEILNRYDGVVIWDVPSEKKGSFVKFCYSKQIRIYLMPKITDVIIRGSSQLHLFDSPILLTRETSLTIEQRIGKRLIDLICSVILTVITSPIMIVTAIAVKAYDGGPVLYKQKRCTIDNKEFFIYKFRSMRTDAEKDGVARLASKNDDRITPIGRFIRKVRIDELPQLINILKGDMSFIGPRPERPEIIEQYMKNMPEFAFRTRVKAGLAGYAQVYGKYNTSPYDKLKLDLFYIENYSLWLDMKLMLLTLKILFRAESTEGVESTQLTALKDGCDMKEEDK